MNVHVDFCFLIDCQESGYKEFPSVASLFEIRKHQI